MRIIHTADWHLGDRLGRVDRTEDLRRAVERVADVCRGQRADVLLVCGDLFSETLRAETLRHTVDHLADTFAPFLRGGGTILAITGNHDSEHFAHILRQAMNLAVPAASEVGDRVAPGRFYLFPGPHFLRLADPAEGFDVQFVLMPWPTPSRYLDEQGQRYASIDERHKALKAAFRRKLASTFEHAAFDPSLPTVLAAHVATAGAEVRDGYRLGSGDGLVVEGGDLPRHFAYVALGDIHRPQCVTGLSHVRYSGSIERMDLGEAYEKKGVVLVDVGPAGRRGEPVWLPLESTPIYKVEVNDPAAELPLLAERFPDRERALVRLAVKYKAGRDNISDVLAELDKIFPRCYRRDWEEASAGEGSEDDREAGRRAAARAPDVGQTVRGFLNSQLEEHPDRADILRLTEELLAQEEQE